MGACAECPGKPVRGTRAKQLGQVANALILSLHRQDASALLTAGWSKMPTVRQLYRRLKREYTQRW